VKDGTDTMSVATNFLSVVIMVIVLCSDNYFQLSFCSLGVSTEIRGRVEYAESMDVLMELSQFCSVMAFGA
jgi:hypothetical protein